MGSQKRNVAGIGRKSSSNPAKFTLSALEFRILIMVIIVSISCFIYLPFKHDLFVQDDPSLLEYFGNPKFSVLEKIFGGAHIANRWRPFANLGYFVGYQICGHSYLAWLILDLTLFVLFCYLAALGISRLAGSQFAGFTTAVLLATSRFAYGQVLNATFLVEGIANLLLVCIIWNFLRFVETNQKKYLLFSVLGNLFLVLDHERFVTVGLAAAATLYLRRLTSKRDLVAYSTLFMLPSLALFSAKAWILHIPLFVGTGRAWGVGFDFRSSINHIIELILGVFGINYGPNQLYGLVWDQQTIAERTASIGICALTLMMTYQLINNYSKYMKRNTTKKFGKSTAMVNWIIIFGALVIPVISTIRIEHRWFIPPLIALFCLWGLSLRESEFMKMNSLQSKRFFQMTALILAVSVFMNISYRSKIREIYFMADQVGVQRTLETLQNAESASKSANKKIFITSEGDLSGFKEWLILFAKANKVSGAENTYILKSGESAPADSIGLKVVNGVLIPD